METALHVWPSADGAWLVRQEGGAGPLSVHAHAWEAEVAATARALVRKVPLVVLHDAYGRTRTRALDD